jgi:hypothetical protein
VGNDVRKLVYDGVPKENIVATDLSQGSLRGIAFIPSLMSVHRLTGFYDIGHKLFKSTPESFPVKFIAGDVFDPSHIALVEDKSTILSSRPPLQTLTSLNPLRGHVSAIHVSFFFHLFDEAGQLQLAQLLAGLLDPRPGSTIYGCHVSMPERGRRIAIVLNDRWDVFCHSTTSWTEMWEEVFGEGVVQVTTGLREVDMPYSGDTDMDRRYTIVWSVVRL